MAESAPQLPDDIATTVERALKEDVGSGDLTAELIPAGAAAEARLTARTDIVLCGRAWFDEVFRQLDPTVSVSWHAADGDTVSAGATVCTIEGPARPILTGERTALNFLQTLSGTATTVSAYVRTIAGTTARLLDTRKTLPGLRLAQKYAVRCGGGENHRKGLYDAILIKENHIAAAGGIGPAVEATRRHGVPVEVEVESLEQLGVALDAGADRILLDNFSVEALRDAVRMRDARPVPDIELEASGGIGLENLREIAETGVDFISIGGLTKNLTAADFSLRFL
ncbi:MAG TPA: carboxylating nicotinate-nucleotide diphosphorylase [Gammaproteobacteria bacterium]